MQCRVLYFNLLCLEMGLFWGGSCNAIVEVLKICTTGRSPWKGQNVAPALPCLAPRMWGEVAPRRTAGWRRAEGEDSQGEEGKMLPRLEGWEGEGRGAVVGRGERYGGARGSGGALPLPPLGSCPQRGVRQRGQGGGSPSAAVTGP